MFVRIRSSTALFRAGCLTICFKEKFLTKDEIGHLLKSPTIKIPAFGCDRSACSNAINRHDIIRSEQE